jgi:hypothetical protein
MVFVYFLFNKVFPTYCIPSQAYFLPLMSLTNMCYIFILAHETPMVFSIFTFIHVMNNNCHPQVQNQT